MLFRILCFIMAVFLIAAGTLCLSQEMSQSRAFASYLLIDSSGRSAQLESQQALVSGSPGQMQQAHQQLEKVLRLSPFDADVWLSLATIRSRIDPGSAGAAQA